MEKNFSHVSNLSKVEIPAPDYVQVKTTSFPNINPFEWFGPPLAKFTKYDQECLSNQQDKTGVSLEEVNNLRHSIEVFKDQERILTSNIEETDEQIALLIGEIDDIQNSIHKKRRVTYKSSKISKMSTSRKDKRIKDTTNANNNKLHQPDADTAAHQLYDVNNNTAINLYAGNDNEQIYANDKVSFLADLGALFDQKFGRDMK